MKTFIKIAVILFVTLALQNCGPKDPTKPDFQMVSQENKDWGVFKLGTWWVFEEETSKLRDSIFVYDIEDVLHKGEKKNGYFSHQTLITKIHSKLGIDTFELIVSGPISGLLLIRIENLVSEFQSSAYLLPDPPIIQGRWMRSGPPSQITQFDTIYPNLQIGDFNFSNVVRANNNMNLAYNYTPTLIYSAKHIGIVRKEFPEYNQVWNLVRYNIVQ